MITRTLGRRPLWSEAMLWAALMGLTSGAGAQQADPLAACHQANDDFDYANVIAECTAGLKVEGVTAETKVEAYRMLGIAHTTLNDEEAAIEAFLNLLAIDPQHDLGPAVSPVYREVFDKAKSLLKERGKVGAALVLNVPQEGAGPWKATAELTDPMGRVHGASLLVRAVRGAAEVGRMSVDMTREGEGFQAEVQDPAPPEIEGDYTLEVSLALQDGAGDELKVPGPPVEQAFPRTGAGVESGSGLWIGLGGGGAAAAVAAVALVAGGGAVVVIGCLATGVCGGGETEPSSHVRVGPAL